MEQAITLFWNTFSPFIPMMTTIVVIIIVAKLIDIATTGKK